MFRSPKKIVALVLLIAALVVVYMGATHRWFGFASTQDAGGQKVLYWYDAMNPQHHYNKPGKAPDGMDLLPQYAEQTASPAAPPSTLPLTDMANMPGMSTKGGEEGPLLVRPDASRLQIRQAGDCSRLRDDTGSEVCRRRKHGQDAHGDCDDISRKAGNGGRAHCDCRSQAAGSGHSHHGTNRCGRDENRPCPCESIWLRREGLCGLRWATGQERGAALQSL